MLKGVDCWVRAFNARLLGMAELLVWNARLATKRIANSRRALIFAITMCKRPLTHFDWENWLLEKLEEKKGRGEGSDYGLVLRFARTTTLRVSTGRMSSIASMAENVGSPGGACLPTK